VIDQLKAAATAKGIETITLDAGDFSEGSQFYFADRGREVWRIMDHMGFDAVALGNHDWLMGTEELDRMLRDVTPNFPVLAANFYAPPRLRNIHRYIQPATTLDRAGLKIAILGLTTPEFVYEFINDRGRIGSHLDAALKNVARLKKDHDAILALTHIGTDGDRALAQNVEGIDLVVGGHSHTRLVEPILIENKKSKRKIPIVQTGRHGESVGDLLVDIEPGKPLKVLRYRLVPVENHEPGIADEKVLDSIARARELLERDYTAEWLYETIAESSVPLEPQENRNPTYWSQLVVDAMMDGAQADLSFDVPEFTGIPHPAGPINREALMQLYPRQFALDQPLGWTLWTTDVRGWMLELGLKLALQSDAVFGLGGVRWHETLKNGKRSVSHIRIGGRKIDPFKSYRVAIPEGIGRGVVEITPALKILLRNSQDTGVPILSAIEDSIRRKSENGSPSVLTRSD
jgi:2',3'-cyclic-nucleotide 2'-phosphodiesterase (5'-nucleotidase family)